MSDILARIATYKREEVRSRKSKTSNSEITVDACCRTPPRGFRDALRRAHEPGRLALIAEIKRASPSRGLFRADFDPAALARAYERGGAACLSVLTDAPSFRGDEAHLVAARAAVALPCLRKDFLIDPWQVAESRAFGADAILLILAIVDDSLAAEILAEAKSWSMDVLVETHDRDEMRRAARLGADLVGVNNRDLRTFVTDLATTLSVAEEAPVNALVVTESGIFTPADVARLGASGAHAMLVGESLMRADDVEAAARALLTPCARST